MGVGSDYSELAEFFLRLFLASQIAASFSLGGCVELALLVEALELTALEEIEQRSTEETVETVTLVSVEDDFTLESLLLWRI